MNRLGCLMLSCLLAVGACGNDAVTRPDGAPPVADAGFGPSPRGQFPKGFMWGATTAAYQSEGSLHNTDWYQWESRCLECSKEGADDGPNFWQLHDNDFANAEKIANNAVRIGIEWARLFPTADQFEHLEPDAEAVAHYHAMLSSAERHGLLVMASLVQFSLPVWIHDLDEYNSGAGWEDESIVERFATYAGWVALEFGADVDYWITLNEPLSSIVSGWIGGSVPPGKSWQISAALKAAEHMIWAHARAYDAIHEKDLLDADDDGIAARVSVAKRNLVYLPKDPGNPEHSRAVELLRYFLNDSFLQAVVFGNIDRNFDFDYEDPNDLKSDPSLLGRLDFIGLNYHGVALVVETANENNFPMIGVPLVNDLDNQGLQAPISDFGQTIYPRGLRPVLDELVPYDLPIIITENGVADATDTVRPRFLVEHLYVLNQAIDDGIKVRGYFYRSLMDQFEWTAGYCPRYGLFRVDFESDGRTRTIGQGAEVYQRIIEDNTVSPNLFAAYPSYDVRGFCTRAPL